MKSVIYDSDAIQSVINRLREHEGDFVYDVETSGLSPLKNHIVGYVLTFGPRPDDTVYVPVRHAGGGNITDMMAPQEPIANTKVQPFEHEFAKIAATKSWNLIGHNLMFDLLFSAHHGILFPNCKLSCTQVRQALVDEFTPSFSLDSSARHMHVTEKKGDALYEHLSKLFGCPADRKSMAHYWRTAGNDPIAVDYAMGDGVSTWELYHAQQKEIDRQDLGRVWDLERRMTKTLFRMQHRGIKIDVDYMESTRAKVMKDCEKMREEFQEFVLDDEGFKERSAGHVEAVYRANGYKDDDFEKTPTGRISFKEEWMEKNDVGKRLIAIRKKANLVASFIGPMLDTHLVEGRCHPNYNQLKGDEFGTISGRLSSNNPNIQQVPKHDEELSKLVRRGFIPDDGYFWASKDAKQCEPRIFAQYTGSKFLIDGYMQKPTIDLYNNLDKITGIGRQKCKKLALALFYIAGNAKAAELMGSSIEEATHCRNLVRQQIPEIDAFNKGAENNVRIRHKTEGVGYVKTVTGRRLRFTDMRFAYKAGNRIVQGGNGDYIKHACNEVSDYLESEGKGCLLLTCHDNIETQIANGNDKINDEVTKIMENAAKCEMINFSIPQEAECGVGKNWAEATFGVN